MMWRTECQQCKWTSGDRITKEAADILGELHVQDNPGHVVTIKRLSPDGTTGERVKPLDP